MDTPTVKPRRPNICPHVQARIKKTQAGRVPTFVCAHTGDCRWKHTRGKRNTVCYGYDFSNLRHGEGRDWLVTDDRGRIPFWSVATGPTPLMTLAELRAFAALETFYGWELNEAARVRLKHGYPAAVQSLVKSLKSGRGQCGPCAPSLQIWKADKVELRLPHTSLRASPDLVLSALEVAKAALAAHDIHPAPDGQLALL